MGGSCATGACQIVSAFAYSAQGLGDELSRALAFLHGAAPIFFPLLAGLIGACVAHSIGRAVERWPKVTGWKAEAGGALLSPPPYLRMARASGGLVLPIISWLPYSGAGAIGRWAYPAVEMSFALVWAGAIAWTGPAFSTWILLTACSLAFFCAWLDLVCHEIPDNLTVPLAFLGLLFSPVEPDAINRIWGALFCGAAVLGAFKLVASAKQVDGVSLGDVAFLGAAGAWVGICGSFTLILASVVAYIAYAGPLRRSGVLWAPMGPALAVGFVFAILSGVRLI